MRALDLLRLRSHITRKAFWSRCALIVQDILCGDQALGAVQLIQILYSNAEVATTRDTIDHMNTHRLVSEYEEHNIN
jgi:hypothetical protein